MGRPEWLDLAVLNIGRSPALLTVKTLVMTASFAFLLEFARRSLNKPRPRVVLGLGLTLVLLSLVIALGLWRRLLWLDVAARCLLGSQLPSAQATSEKIPFLYALGLLVALAERMRGLMRAYDIVSRWSGKEFIVLLPVTHLNGACRILERLRAEIAAMGVPRRRTGHLQLRRGRAPRQGDHGQSHQSRLLLLGRGRRRLRFDQSSGMPRVLPETF